jgi:Cof subfamily protein (haloacid dehalogenase superfamily)
MTIRLIAADIDGTLLNSQHQLSARNEQALRKAMAQGVGIVLATGKTQHSAVPLIQQLGLRLPGVYVQGLLIAEPDGTVRYQRLLEPDLAHEVADLATSAGCSMVAYAGRRLLTNVRDAYTDVFIRYHEPTPEAFGSWGKLLDENPINKYIMVSTKERIDALRPEVEAHINGRATIVQALDYMLEILPLGGSKGDGVGRLLADLDVPAEQVLALGDGENDVEMLQLAGIGVAMANGMASAKQAADYVTASHDEDGVALAIERFVLGGEGTGE